MDKLVCPWMFNFELKTSLGLNYDGDETAIFEKYYFGINHSAIWIQIIRAGVGAP